MGAKEQRYIQALRRLVAAGVDFALAATEMSAAAEEFKPRDERVVLTAVNILKASVGRAMKLPGMRQILE